MACASSVTHPLGVYLVWFSLSISINGVVIGLNARYRGSVHSNRVYLTGSLSALGIVLIASIIIATFATTFSFIASSAPIATPLAVIIVTALGTISLFRRSAIFPVLFSSVVSTSTLLTFLG